MMGRQKCNTVVYKVPCMRSDASWVKLHLTRRYYAFMTSLANSSNIIHNNQLNAHKTGFLCRTATVCVNDAIANITTINRHTGKTAKGIPVDLSKTDFQNHLNRQLNVLPYLSFCLLKWESIISFKTLATSCILDSSKQPLPKNSTHW